MGRQAEPGPSGFMWRITDPCGCDYTPLQLALRPRTAVQSGSPDAKRSKRCSRHPNRNRSSNTGSQSGSHRRLRLEVSALKSAQGCLTSNGFSGSTSSPPGKGSRHLLPRAATHRGNQTVRPIPTLVADGRCEWCASLRGLPIRQQRPRTRVPRPPGKRGHVAPSSHALPSRSPARSG